MNYHFLSEFMEYAHFRSYHNVSTFVRHFDNPDNILCNHFKYNNKPVSKGSRNPLSLPSVRGIRTYLCSEEYFILEHSSDSVKLK